MKEKLLLKWQLVFILDINIVSDRFSIRQILNTFKTTKLLLIMDIEELIYDVLDQIKNVFGYKSTVGEDVEASIAEACGFFRISKPADIQEGNTTGVILKDKSSLKDDVLSFSKEQMLEMGIESKDGLDLVMTHECTHRILQTMKTGFNSWDEELCCDYMAGVRAGLNNIDTTDFISSLEDTQGSDTHPDGALRVKAVNDGITYAKQCSTRHETPSFNDCFKDFQNSINKGEFPDVDDTANNYSDEIKGFIDDKAYHMSKADKAKRWEEWHTKKGNEAADRGDLSAAKDHYERARAYHQTMKDELSVAKSCKK